MDEQAFLQRIKKTVLTEQPSARIILYGSRARGDFHKESDWDVLVLTEKKLDANTEADLINKVYKIELDSLQPISLLILEKAFWDDWEIMPLHKNVSKEGIVL